MECGKDKNQEEAPAATEAVTEEGAPNKIKVPPYSAIEAGTQEAPAKRNAPEEP